MRCQVHCAVHSRLQFQVEFQVDFEVEFEVQFQVRCQVHPRVRGAPPLATHPGAAQIALPGQRTGNAGLSARLPQLPYPLAGSRPFEARTGA